MKAKILQNLTNKYKHLGLSAEVLDGVATQLSAFVTEETAIEPAVNGAEGMLKSFQKYADSRVTSFRTEAEQNKANAEALKAKLAELEGGNKGGGTDPNPDNNDAVTKLINSFNAKFEELNTTIGKLSSERQQETLTQKLTSLIGNDVPKSFYELQLSGRQFKDEAEVTTFAEALKENYGAFKQELANNGFEQTRPPEASGGAVKETEAIANLINKGTEKIVEQTKK